MILEHKEFFFKGILGLHPVLVLDCLLPHAHELPALELLEEGKFLNVIVGITFNQPLPQREELDGGIVFVQSQTFP
jgi:hypothetical protein